MNTVFIISLAGSDQPNLIQTLAEFTHNKEGHWLSSKVTYLDGHIAAIIKIEAPAENKDAIVSFFCQQDKISCHVENINIENQSPQNDVVLTVKANDRNGLVRDITHVIDKQHAELVHIENYRFCVQPIGTNVFVAEVTVRLSKGNTIESLIDGLKSVDEHIIVSHEIKENEKTLTAS